MVTSYGPGSNGRWVRSRRGSTRARCMSRWAGSSRPGWSRRRVMLRLERPERRVYELTAAGRERVEEWIRDVTWPRPDLTNFHLKLVVAAAGRLADPVEVIGAQRRELVRPLRDAQRAAMAEPVGSDASLLLEGVVLRTEADLAWLDSCERAWARTDERCAHCRVGQALRQG